MPSAEELRGKIERIRETLVLSGADVKWVERENLHFTLKFLGDVPESGIPEISGALYRVSSMSRPFMISLRGVGFFPPSGKMRVVWLGIEDGREMASLQERIEEAMADLGFPGEKGGFRAHLTLGRVRSSRGMGALREAAGKLREAEAGEMPVDSFSLMRSRLTPGGPQYSLVGEFRLGLKT